MSAGPILFHNTMRIHEGHLDDYRRAIQEAVDFVAQYGPQTMVQVFIDEERLLGHSFQLYADTAAILLHWRLSDPYIQNVMAHCAVRRLDVYGRLDQAVLDGLAGAGDKVELTITPWFAGFLR